MRVSLTVPILSSPQPLANTPGPVIATADSKETILALLPALLAEDKIRAVCMGGGFSNEIYTQVRDAIDGSKNVPWIRPEESRPGYQGPPLTGPPAAEEVSTRIRKAVEVHIDALRQGKGAGEVWYY